MRARPTVLALAALLLLAHSAGAQSAAEILSTALDRHEQRAADVDNYTVIQNVAGMRVPIYFEKRMKDGHAVFEPTGMVRRTVQGSAPGPEQQLGSGVGSAEMLVRMSDRTRVAGTESVDGRMAWILQVDDASDLGLGSDEFTPSTLTIHLDQLDYVPLRMAVAGQMEVEGRSHAVTMKTKFEDYREVHGLLHPFRSTITLEGMSAMMDGVDPDDVRNQMAELRKQLEDMPPEQRRMMEEQMKNMPQMEQMMEQMAAMAAGEAMEMTVEVEEIRVNDGPPSGG